jgi:hypothetical protein
MTSSIRDCSEVCCESTLASLFAADLGCARQKLAISYAQMSDGSAVVCQWILSKLVQLRECFWKSLVITPTIESL